MKKLILALAAIAALASCQKKDEMKPYVGDTERPVMFSVENLYSLETKAPISTGREVGIYAGAPISKNNVIFKATMTGENAGTLAPLVTNSLLWGVGQTTQETNFMAIYPYIVNYPLEGGASESEKYTPYVTAWDSYDSDDDFIVAAASQAPGSGETPAKVALNFRHPLVKLVYTIDNQTDDYVSFVEVSGIHRRGRIMFTTGIAVATGDPASEVETNEIVPNSRYEIIVMPETSAVNPVVRVVMVSGTRYTFSLAAGRALEGGKIYTASISLTGSHGTEESDRTMLGTFTVTDWENVNAGAMNGGVSSEASKWWYLEGNIDEIGGTTDGNWNKHIPFRCVGQHTWEVDFYYAATETDVDHGFKIRRAADPSDWTEAYGKDTVIDAAGIGNEGCLVQGTSTEGSNIRINAQGEYRIRYYTDTHDFHIYKLD